MSHSELTLSKSRCSPVHEPGRPSPRRADVQRGCNQMAEEEMRMGEIEALPDEVAGRLADCNRNGLKSAKPTERERAVRALAKPEYRAHKQVLRALFRMTGDADRYVRKEVAIALGVLSPRGDSSSVALLGGLLEDREWHVRCEAIKALVMVECGPKVVEHKSNSHWRPAGKRVIDLLRKSVFDQQPEIRCATAEAVAEAIPDGDPDDLVFDLILTAGSNSMTIDKTFARQVPQHGEISRSTSVASLVEHLGFGRSASIVRAASGASQRSSGSRKWLSAFERMKSNPNLERTEAHFSKLGQVLHMEGTGILVKPSHPPLSLDADLELQHDCTSTPGLKWDKIDAEEPMEGVQIRNEKLEAALQHRDRFTKQELDEFEVNDLSWDSYVQVHGTFFRPGMDESCKMVTGNIAMFPLHPRQMTLRIIYDCAYRSARQQAVGAIFCVQKPELVAADRYDKSSMQSSFDAATSNDNLMDHAPTKIDIPVVFISDTMKDVLADGALVTVMPNNSPIRGLVADQIPAVRAAAVRALSCVARRNEPRLLDVLVELIEDPADEVRRACVEAFINPAKVWPGNPLVIEELVKVSTHENWKVREDAMTALCKVANCDRSSCDPDGEVNNPKAIQAVIARLHDENGLVKKLAIDGLVTLALADGIIDEEDLPIIDSFVDGQEDADPLVASACSKALALLSGEDEQITKSFPWVCDCRPQIRTTTADTLGKAHIKDNTVVISMLKKRTFDSMGQVRASAARSIARVAAQGNTTVLQILDRLLGDTDAAVRCAAVDAFGIVMTPYEQDPDGSLPRLLKLVEMVKDSDSGVRDSAGLALGACAFRSLACVSHLEAVLTSDTNFCVRKKALECIHRIVDVGETSIVQAISIALRDSRGEVRKLGFQLLKDHYEVARDAGVDDALIRVLKESVLECVTDSDPMVVFVTIEAIPALFAHGNRHAIMALVRCLRHEAPSVLEASIRVLGTFADRGDIRAINYIAPMIDHDMAYVRYASIIALKSLGVPGELRVLEPILKKMNDSEIFVRREAVDALQYLALRDDEKCASALLDSMEDPDERIRTSAMSGLSRVASYGDPRAVAAFMKKIRLDTRPMRKLAVESLALLVQEEDYDNLGQLMESLEDTEHIVRQAGVQAVIDVVHQGDPVVIKIIMESKFTNPDPKIRAVALQVLQGIASHGDPNIIQGMITALGAKHVQVRKMAIEVICTVATKGDEEVIKALADALADDNHDVRRVAAAALRELAEMNSAFAITHVAQQLACSEWFVREAAQQTLFSIAEKGNHVALANLQALLGRSEWFVRETAIVCIQHLSAPCSCDFLDDYAGEQGYNEWGNEITIVRSQSAVAKTPGTCGCSAVKLMLDSLEDPVCRVQLAAMAALAVIASPRDKRVALACRARLKHGDFNVRAAAEAMLRTFE